MKTTIPLLALLCLPLAACASPASPAWGGYPALLSAEGSQPGEPAPAAPDSMDLAKKNQNPVADLVSLPFQFNFNFRVGAGHDEQTVLNVQPVIPQHLSADWNWIHRVIVPVIDQPDPSPGVEGETGLGDVVYQGFLSPAKPGKVIWGVGPVVLLPTATDEVLGTEKWGAGPAAVVLTMDGPWVYGGLANHIRSFAGEDDRDDVSLTTIQPFVNYNLAGGWALTTGPIITANWEADRGRDTWTVPVGGGVSKILKIGSQPVSLGLQGFYNVAHPEGGPSWTVRFTFSLLFPF